MRGTHDVIAVTPVLTNIDTDTVAWAPDGRSLTVGGDAGDGPHLYRSMPAPGA